MPGTCDHWHVIGIEAFAKHQCIIFRHVDRAAISDPTLTYNDMPGVDRLARNVGTGLACVC